MQLSNRKGTPRGEVRTLIGDLIIEASNEELGLLIDFFLELGALRESGDVCQLTLKDYANSERVHQDIIFISTENDTEEE